MCLNQYIFYNNIFLKRNDTRKRLCCHLEASTHPSPGPSWAGVRMAGVRMALSANREGTWYRLSPPPSSPLCCTHMQASCSKIHRSSSSSPHYHYYDYVIGHLPQQPPLSPPPELHPASRWPWGRFLLVSAIAPGKQR